MRLRILRFAVFRMCRFILVNLVAQETNYPCEHTIIFLLVFFQLVRCKNTILIEFSQLKLQKTALVPCFEHRKLKITKIKTLTCLSWKFICNSTRFTKINLHVFSAVNLNAHNAAKSKIEGYYHLQLPLVSGQKKVWIYAGIGQET